MKIAAISDIHGMLPLPCKQVDLVIIAGDICPDVSPVGQEKWLEKEFTQWCALLPTKQILATWGNHDFVGQMLLKQPKDFYVDEMVEVDGIKIWLSPWVPNLPRWAFSFPNDIPEEKVKGIPTCDILVSHGPPRGAGDHIPGVGRTIHVGSETLRDHLKVIEPMMVICGHIHEARGYYGTVRNVASVDGNYVPYPERWTYIELT